jgi:hypothetical protein
MTEESNGGEAASVTTAPIATTTTEKIHHQAVKWVLDYRLSVEDKIQNACHLSPPEEGCLHMSTASKLTIAPSLDWSDKFRKSYSLLLWMRPQAKQGAAASATSDGRDVWRQAQEDHVKQESCLYRLEQAQTTQAWLGVNVSMGDWMPKGDHHMETWVKATTLEGGTNSPKVETKLRLPTETWSLVAMTHIFPYLKRPQWTLTVNGNVLVSGELPYPSLDHLTGKNAARNMDLTLGGWNGTLSSWAVYQEPIPPEALALIAEAGPSISNSQQPGSVIPRVPPIANASKGYSLDGRSKVGCCLLVHPLSQALQPLVDAHVVGWGYHQGPTKRERLGTPPVHRYTWNLPKCPGRTKDVPRVGLIQPQPPFRQPFWTMTVHHGELVHPTHVILNPSMDDDDSGSSVIKRYNPHSTPSIRLAVLDQGLHRWILPFFAAFPVTMLTDDSMQARLQRHSLHHLWGLLHEVPSDGFVGLPRFFERKKEAWARFYNSNGPKPSAQQQEDVCLAAILLHVLAEWIAVGGARVHEHILQEGIFHMLSVCLRWTLLRAEAWEMYKHESVDKLIKLSMKTTKEEDVWMQQIQQGVRRYRPKYIPPSISTAVVHLLEACFFGSSSTSGSTAFLGDPWSQQWLQLRLTGDLALTALFGLALDFDLWGGQHYESAAKIWKVVAKAYGGCHIEAGTVVRSQISVQFLLDNIRLSLDEELSRTGKVQFQHQPSSMDGGSQHGSKSVESQEKHQALQESAMHLANILKAMLLASLSNKRSISQGENDVSACIGALSSCPLGSVGCHVILHALIGVLEWCEVLPTRVNADDSRAYSGSSSSTASQTSMLPPQPMQSLQDDEEIEEAKRRMSSRLARNLMSAQFHDVVAPMLLSRTVFAGDKKMPAPPPPAYSSVNIDEEEDQPLLSWQNHWRWVLLIYSWCASVAGPEGIISAQSSGSLLLASGLAGSLKGILQSMEPNFVTTLFLPTLSSSGANEDAYTDLLAARLQVMMPLLPGMVVSLLEHPLDATADTAIPRRSVEVVSELLTAVGASFTRIFSQWNMALSSVSKQRFSLSSERKQTSIAIVNQIVQAAKVFAPPLMIITMLIENHIQLRNTPEDDDQGSPLTLLRVNSGSGDARPENQDDDAWVEVSRIVRQLSSSALMTSHSEEAEAELPDDASERQITVARLKSCQKSVMTTLTDLIAVSMKLGGGEATTSFWRTILATLKESVAYSANAPAKKSSEGEEGPDSSPKEMSKEEALVERKAHAESLAHNILCRMAAFVLIKCLKRESPWELWSGNLCSAVSKLCILIEEKDLFMRLLGPVSSEYGERTYSTDQVLLLGTLLNILEYGREVTGWCQLVLPNPRDGHSSQRSLNHSSRSLTMTGSTDAEEGTPKRKSSIVEVFKMTPTRSKNQALGTSKLMLQVLQPTLRIVLGSVGNITTLTRVIAPQPLIKNDTMTTAEKDGSTVRNCLLLEYTFEELESTMTAAIVGMSFANARDVCMNTLASLRRAVLRHQHRDDDRGVELCFKMISTVAEEMRVRYEGERRKRETALFDAYEENHAVKQKAKDAAEASRTVENLMLGGDIMGAVMQSLSGETLDSKEDKTKSSSEEDGSNEAGDFAEVDETAGTADGEDVPEVVEEGEPSSAQKETSEKMNEDFVMFPDSSDGGDRAMGWAKYDGFATALDNCSAVAQSIKKTEGGTDSASENADKVLATLAPFLDKFDETVALEAAESELVELFDTNIRLDSGALASPQMQIVGSETAADAMTSFIEFAAVEKSRLTEISASFLPGHRYSRLAYTHRFCWARYIELAGPENDFSMHKFWERGINDGNRDVRSRLITMPCSPQFKRYIPKYLDHSPDDDDAVSECTDMEASVMIDDSERPAPSAKKSKRNSLDKFLSRRSTKANKSRRQTAFFAAELNMDDDDDDEDLELEKFAKTLSAATGGHIVDITKKADQVSDEPDVILESHESDDDETYIAEGESKSSQRTQSQEAAASLTDQSVRESVNEPPLQGFSPDAKAGAAHYNITSSAFASPPDNSSSSLSIMHSAAAALIEQYLDNCLHVKAEGSRKCTMLLTSMHLILEYDMEEHGHFEGEVMAAQEETDRLQRMSEDAHCTSKEQESDRRVMDQAQRHNKEEAALRPKSIRFNLSEVSHIYLRRYRLRDSSLELFFIPSGGTAFGGYGIYSPLTSLFLDFGPGQEGLTRRDDAAFAIMRRTPPQTIKQWPDRAEQFLHEQLNRLTIGWAEGRITNFDYLLHLNMLAGRSYNDICQYPVMPWVLANYKDEDIPDLYDPSNFRDLSKPVGALNPSRLQDFIERFSTFADPLIPPFMYGSHYSTSAGVVLHFLVRMHPFAGLHRQLQSGHFDVADRLFSSIPRTWDMCTGSSAAEVKELTPEFYCNPSFLKNANNFKLGTSQDGDVLGDVTLPPWANGSPEKFVEVMRSALESEICSQMLPDWIDLIFGRKQQGPAAVEAHNVFFYLTYYGSVDVANIEDDGLRQATELQIAHFGQCPMQLFTRPHIRRLSQASRFRKLSFYQLLSTYTQNPNKVRAPKADGQTGDGATRHLQLTEPAFLAFFAAPLSHWVQLDAPPPGPHAPLVAVRLAGTDRCVAVDRQGIFHCFRWAWKSEEVEPVPSDGPIDKGCFVAQRELPRFRAVPRLIHFNMTDQVPPVAISKTLFAGGSVLLVLSDGDGHGGLGMQLLDPSKGTVRGEAVVPSIHSARITCIAADPIGSAAGHGGVGGELAVVGSADGNASLWRFMSSHYLPLRPRVRLQGHHGSKVCAVAISSAIQLVASTSADRCCLFSIGNGAMLRSWGPPSDALELTGLGESVKVTTKFADTPALAISVQGYVIVVCDTSIEYPATPDQNRHVMTIHLYTLEGVSLGSQPLEQWRGIPHKMSCTPDGTAILICSGRGTTVHRLSALAPLQFLDEWQITEVEDLTSDTVAHAWDIDLGPNLSRPVVAATACSEGVLRLHALPGISAWSERHRKSNITQSVGNALAKPAQRFTKVMRDGFGLGSKAVATGQEVGKEVASTVKEQSSGGFGGLFRSGGLFRNKSGGNKK